MFCLPKTAWPPTYPLSMLGIVQHPDLEPVAEEARARLDRVAKALAA